MLSVDCVRLGRMLIVQRHPSARIVLPGTKHLATAVYSAQRAMQKRHTVFRSILKARMSTKAIG